MYRPTRPSRTASARPTHPAATQAPATARASANWAARRWPAEAPPASARRSRPCLIATAPAPARCPRRRPAPATSNAEAATLASRPARRIPTAWRRSPARARGPARAARQTQRTGLRRRQISASAAFAPTASAAAPDLRNCQACNLNGAGSCAFLGAGADCAGRPVPREHDLRQHGDLQRRGRVHAGGGHRDLRQRDVHRDHLHARTDLLGGGDCPPATATTCGTYVCGTGGACKTNCNGDTDCATRQLLHGHGRQLRARRPTAPPAAPPTSVRAATASTASAARPTLRDLPGLQPERARDLLPGGHRREIRTPAASPTAPAATPAPATAPGPARRRRRR